ncbi:hypothetical protein ACQP10_05855 [Streptosporangium sandarakinum]|uniref:hypothetical protein n=1 Tax=Streptosporangium sandarakinum TaxID=1260955 RepID=UPI003D8BE125
MVDREHPFATPYQLKGGRLQSQQAGEVRVGEAGGDVEGGAGAVPVAGDRGQAVERGPGAPPGVVGPDPWSRDGRAVADRCLGVPQDRRPGLDRRPARLLREGSSAPSVDGDTVITAVPEGEGLRVIVSGGARVTGVEVVGADVPVVLTAV